MDSQRRDRQLRAFIALIDRTGMYVPGPYREDDPQALQAIMRAAPFATLVSTGPDGLNATHVPMLFDADPVPNGTLLCHVARANPQWKTIADSEVLVIFNGPDAYVTPSWYPRKAETGDVVPTWNYTAVHAYGRPRIVEDRDTLLALVSRLTDAHESPRSEPWSVADAPEDYIKRLLAAIVGIIIPVERIIGAKKLGQNQPARERAGVIAGLMRESSP